MQQSVYKVSCVVRRRQNPIMWPQLVAMARPVRQGDLYTSTLEIQQAGGLYQSRPTFRAVATTH